MTFLEQMLVAVCVALIVVVSVPDANPIDRFIMIFAASYLTNVFFGKLASRS
jgi:hypothetical protein